MDWSGISTAILNPRRSLENLFSLQRVAYKNQIKANIFFSLHIAA